MAALESILTPTYSEEKWVSEISENFDTESPIDDLGSIPISVCTIPKSVSSLKPQAYAPQLVALGPYHHLRPELYQMERFKIASIKSSLTPEQNGGFQRSLVASLKRYSLQIRACYHKYLTFNDETLAWIVAVDGLFLLFILSAFRVGAQRPTDVASSDVYRDVMMLENQIPTILLKKIRKVLTSIQGTDVGLDENHDDTDLFDMMWGFCESQSPFQVLVTRSKYLLGQKGTSLHLLDLLYKMIIARDDQGSVEPVSSSTQEESALNVRGSEVSLQIIQTSSPPKLFHNIEKIVEVEARLAAGTTLGKPVEVIEKLPWEMISNLIGFKTGTRPDDTTKIEEIQIPSVSKLCKLAGVEFRAAVNGGIWDVKFDENTGVLYLPVVTLNSNSEVVLRNLVAFESASSSRLVLAKYVDLLSGIIDTEEDVDRLKKKGIINGSLSNAEIVDVFNGMNKLPGNVYNEAASKINDYYNKKPRVRAREFMKRRLYTSWRGLTVVSTILLLLLLILQSFCDVYGCHRFFS